MIIKNLTRRSGSGQLLKYIFKYIHQEKQETPAPFIIRHNLRSNDVNGFVKEFKDNAKRRVHIRKDQTAIHHTILSWSNKDTSRVTPAMIKTMAKRYISLRGESNLYVGTIHTDRDHVHLHLAMSGNQMNGLSSRISRQEFAQLKVSLDSYQQEQFPELINSLPEHGKAKSQAQENRLILELNTQDQISLPIQEIELPIENESIPENGVQNPISLTPSYRN